MYLTNNLKYDKENLDKVSKLILDNLTPDLVAVKFRARNAVQPLFGYCYPASACLQKIFGSKNIKLYHAKDDEDIWHWWTVDKDGQIISGDMKKIKNALIRSCGYLPCTFFICFPMFCYTQVTK